MAILVALANLTTLRLLPRSVANRYRPLLFGLGICALGGPVDGGVLLAPASDPPREVWVTAEDGAIASYGPQPGQDKDVLRHRPDRGQS